jgi:hypothetical protein
MTILDKIMFGLIGFIVLAVLCFQSWDEFREHRKSKQQVRDAENWLRTSIAPQGDK